MSTDEKSEADKLMESFVPTQVTLKGKYKLTKKTKLLLRHEENLMIVVQPVSLYRNGVSLEITVMKGVYTYGKQSPADIETGRSADKTESGKDKEGPQGTLPPA